MKRNMQTRRRLAAQLKKIGKALDGISDAMILDVSVSPEEHSRLLDVDMLLWRLRRDLSRARGDA